MLWVNGCTISVTYNTFFIFNLTLTVTVLYCVYIYIYIYFFFFFCFFTQPFALYIMFIIMLNLLFYGNLESLKLVFFFMFLV